MMRIIVDECVDIFYQTQITEHLGLTELESYRNGHKHWIVKELLARLEHQGIIKTFRQNGKKYFSKVSDDEYKPPPFVVPKPNISRGEYYLYQIILKMQRDGLLYKFILQYPGPKTRYSKTNTRYDMAIFMSEGSKIPDGYLEFDGDQHHKMTPIFHKTEEEFQQRVKIDKEKDNFANKISILGIMRFTKKDLNKTNLSSTKRRIKLWLQSYHEKSQNLKITSAKYPDQITV